MSKDSNVITAGQVVEITFTMKNDDGETIAETTEGHTTAYLHGTEQFLPGVAESLEGHAAGESIKVVIPPKDGFGERTGDGPQPVPRSSFPEDIELPPGECVVAETEDGNQVLLWVIGVDGDNVLLDQDHPLAGETLHYEIEIVAVREASPEEVEHSHAHQPDEDGDDHCDSE